MGELLTKTMRELLAKTMEELFAKTMGELLAKMMEVACKNDGGVAGSCLQKR